MASMGNDGSLSLEGAWSATTGASEDAKPSKGRFSARRKAAAVMRLLCGEELESLSRELGVTAATLAGWRDAFVAAGQAALKTRPPDYKDEEIARLKAKIGDLTMGNERLYEKIHRMEAGHPLRRRRSRR